MSQVTIYLPDELERELRAAAKKAGKSFSAYLAELASRKKKAGGGWPKAFRATFGGWEGELEEPPELEPEEREAL